MKNDKSKLEKKGRFFYLLFTALIAVFAVGCDDDDMDTMPPENLPTMSIMEIVDATPAVSTLQAAIDAAGLREALNGEGPLTVFAPSNDAFTAFSTANPGVLEYLLDTPEELAKVLTYHVHNGYASSADLIDGELSTLNGQTVDIDLTSGVKVNDASVTTADVLATNGVIHLIDQVLVPDNVNIPDNLDANGMQNSIGEIAIGTADLSSLVAILSLTGLSDILEAALNDDAELTVFAPTNDAFAAVLTALGLSSIEEIPESVLLDIVKYHIVGSVALSSDLMSTTYPTLNGESVTVDLTNGVMVDNANVVAADIKASNGVVHVIDAVLLPSLYKNALGTIVEVPLFRKSYLDLTTALVKADLVNTLLTDGPFTVFAPDNDAFDAANIDVYSLTGEQLKPYLLYHVLGSKVLSNQLPADGVVTTLNSGGSDKFFMSLGTDVYINGKTKVTGVDIEKSNGVIHTINRTLVPPTESVVEIAVALSTADTPEFTTLVSLLTSPAQQAVLTAISGDGPFTVFAPTDAAFAEIASVTATLTDEQISSVLTYHVIGARIYSTDLTDGVEPATVNGQTVTVNLGDTVTITDSESSDLTADATVIIADVNGTNGVIHAIDKVLVPVL
ncbi:MAG: fasciclin domain-containing protein [Reichenbachiella sp.]